MICLVFRFLRVDLCRLSLLLIAVGFMIAVSFGLDDGLQLHVCVLVVGLACQICVMVCLWLLSFLLLGLLCDLLLWCCLWVVSLFTLLFVWLFVSRFVCGLFDCVWLVGLLFMAGVVDACWLRLLCVLGSCGWGAHCLVICEWLVASFVICSVNTGYGCVLTLCGTLLV